MWMRTQKGDRRKVILHRLWSQPLKRWRLQKGDTLNEYKKARLCPNLMNSATLNWRKYHQINQQDRSAQQMNSARAPQRKFSHKLLVWMDLRCSESPNIAHETRRKACTLQIQSLLFMTSELRVQTEVTFSLKSKGMYNLLWQFRTQIGKEKDKETVNDWTYVWWSDYVLWP